MTRDYRLWLLEEQLSRPPYPKKPANIMSVDGASLLRRHALAAVGLATQDGTLIA